MPTAFLELVNVLLLAMIKRRISASIGLVLFLLR